MQITKRLYKSLNYVTRKKKKRCDNNMKLKEFNLLRCHMVSFDWLFFFVYFGWVFIFGFRISTEMMAQIHAQHAERYRLLECEQKIHVGDYYFQRISLLISFFIFFFSFFQKKKLQLLTLKSKMKTEYKAMKNIFDENELLLKNQHAIKKYFCSFSFFKNSKNLKKKLN